jgi:hypothetical protein
LAREQNFQIIHCSNYNRVNNRMKFFWKELHPVGSLVDLGEPLTPSDSISVAPVMSKRSITPFGLVRGDSTCQNTRSEGRYWVLTSRTTLGRMRCMVRLEPITRANQQNFLKRWHWMQQDPLGWLSVAVCATIWFTTAMLSKYQDS